MIKAQPHESHIFANAYEREMTDVINLHRQIAIDIDNKIEAPTVKKEKESIQDQKKINTEAYEAYLKGSFHWNKLTKEDLEMAEDYFNLAIEKDAEYALAYVGMASIGVARAQMGYASWKESAIISQSNLEKAKYLDPSLAEIHFIEAVFSFNSLWKWEKAEAEFIKALNYNPNYAILANDPNVPSIYADPIFDYLRDEVEFKELIERLNFPAQILNRLSP